MISDATKKEHAVFETPVGVAEQLVQLVGVSEGDKVLEPSCGSGRIVRACIAAGATGIRAYDIRQEAVDEVNSIAGAVALCRNFLEVDPVPEYSKVVMNPPFTRGDDIEHVLHAFKFLAPDGVLGAIVAARGHQRFTERLEGEWALLCYEKLPDLTFEDEGTSVSTAVIVLHNRAEIKSQDYSNAKRPEVHSTEAMPSISVDRVILQMDIVKAALARVDEAARIALDEYHTFRKMFPDVIGTGGRFDPRAGTTEFYPRHERSSTTNAFELTKEAWAGIVRASQAWTIMDKKERDLFTESIESPKTCMPFTVNSVIPTLSRLRQESGKFFIRGIEAVFRKMSWDHKTNSPLRFGKKQIYRFACRPSFSGYPQFPYGGTNLDALYNALYLLDGKPEPVVEESLGYKAEKYWQDVKKYADYEDQYIRIRAFKNQNLHVWILRDDLLDLLNQTMGKAIPFARRIGEEEEPKKRR